MLITQTTCDCAACREARDATARENAGCTCPWAGWNPECPSHGFERNT